MITWEDPYISSVEKVQELEDEEHTDHESAHKLQDFNFFFFVVKNYKNK